MVQSSPLRPDRDMARRPARRYNERCISTVRPSYTVFWLHHGMPAITSFRPCFSAC